MSTSRETVTTLEGVSMTGNSASKRSRRVFLRLLFLANVGASALYVGWWVMPNHMGVPILFFLLAGAEAFYLFQRMGLLWTIWATSWIAPPKRRRTFLVDVFITTCGEPLKVLEATIAAAVTLDEPHRTLVLDDMDRPEVKALASSLGAEYIARGNRRGAKAGSLNYALSMTSAHLFAIFDADQIPHSDFLSQTLGYFEDKTVAFVQTPQSYRNAPYNQVTRITNKQQGIFYSAVCPGKNGLRSVFCCGTNAVLRRTAIQEVGGFEESSIVEDLLTSMHIHRRGWNSVYHPHVLAEGLGPSNFSSYFRQQFRWARGSLGVLLSLELCRHGYSLTQRFQYLLTLTFYFNGLVTLIDLLLPILYLLGGWSAFSPNAGSFAIFYGFSMSLSLITLRLSGVRVLDLEPFQYTFGSFPVYLLAFLAAALHIPAQFRVTGGSDESVRTPFLVWVSAFAFVATILAIDFAIFVRPMDPRTFTSLFWAVVNLLLLSGIVRRSSAS